MTHYLRGRAGGGVRGVFERRGREGFAKGAKEDKKRKKENQFQKRIPT
jgi:hypothetical protein